VKNVAKLVIKISIYPAKEELRGATEGYLAKNNLEFYNRFNEESWIAFFNTNIRQKVSFFYNQLI
jgi:hypothetical protein